MSNFNDACHLIRFGFNKWGTSSQAECSSLPSLHGTAQHQTDNYFINLTVFVVRNRTNLLSIIICKSSGLYVWAVGAGAYNMVDGRGVGLGGKVYRSIQYTGPWPWIWEDAHRECLCAVSSISCFTLSQWLPHKRGQIQKRWSLEKL